ncbi:HSP20-like chaperone [Obelidium mucronatum]|nr:HSP20-like chaperone [Obelidium mucronatum]
MALSSALSLNDMLRMFQQDSNLAMDPFQMPSKNALTNVPSFPVPLDVTETPKEFVILCDMPGFEKSNVNVSLNGQVLTVSGERTSTTDQTTPANRHVIERRHGSFMRRVSLPSSVDASDVKALLENGVLHVRVGKSSVNVLKGNSIPIE